MKQYLGLVILAFLANDVCAQLVANSLSYIDYVNVGFLRSKVIADLPIRGLRLGPALLDKNELDLTANLSLDSNSYSSAVFNIGSVATQNIGLSLIRPISHTGAIEMLVYRESNPGWVARSFYRKTNIQIGYSQDFTRRIKWITTIGINVLDREQNGGVLDSIFYNIQTRGTTELNLEGNVWLENAYNRRTHTIASAELVYSLVETENFTLNAGLILLGSFEKYRFEDLSPDSNYYAHFSGTLRQEVQDSFALGYLSIQPKIQLEMEPVDSIRIGFEIGATETWYMLSNNGVESSPINQSIHCNLDLDAWRLKLRGRAERYIAGYNRSDISLSTKAEVIVLGTDASKGFMSFDTKQHYSSGRVSRVFENYRSQVRSINNRLVNEEYAEFGLGLNSGFGALGANIDLDYLKIGNLAYFDEVAKVNQKRVPIEVYSAQLKFVYSNSFFELSTIGRYQWTGRSRYYSLPEWTNINQGSVYCDMFKKRLRMKGGIQTRFFSEFFSRGYLPFYDIEYVQSFHRYEDYFQLDAHLQTTIKSVSVGVFAYNVLYGVFDTNPIVSPNMPSIPRYFSLRFDWNFKN